jgi:serine/threonine-protein kinase RsbW
MSGEIDSPRVRLELTSRPEAARLVRSVSSAAGEALGFDPELQGDLNTAVAEACNNVILHAYTGGPGPLAGERDAPPDGVEVRIRDHGCGLREAAPEPDRLKVGLALMSALADRAEFSSTADGGTEVRLTFLHPSGPQPGYVPAAAPVSNGNGARHPSPGGSVHSRGARHLLSDGLLFPGSVERVVNLPGDVVLTVSPVNLLGPILGRLGRTLAPSAGFSLERCYDVYLLTDVLAAHAERAAQAAAVTVSLGARDSRLEFALAPLRAGSSDRLDDLPEARAAALSRLTEEVAVNAVDDYETLRVSMGDPLRG